MRPPSGDGRRAFHFARHVAAPDQRHLIEPHNSKCSVNLLPESPLSWLGLALLLCWFVGARNRLMRLRTLVLTTFDSLDVALLGQLDFVQVSARNGAGAAARSASSVVLAPSDDVLRAGLQASAQQFTALLSAARAHPLEPGMMAALSTSLHLMLGAWQRLYLEAVTCIDDAGSMSRSAPPGDVVDAADVVEAVAVVITRPDDSAVEVDAAGDIAWPEPSAAADIARARFNLAVAHYNAAVHQFPALLLARLFRLRRAAPMA